MRRKAFTLGELVGVLFIFVLVGLAFAGCGMGCMPNYSDGQRVGDVVKFSRKGVIFKSYEGDLVLNAFNLKNRDQNVGNLFSFSVTDPAVAAEMEKNIGRRVKIHYHQYLFAPWTQSTEYTVSKIELVE